MPMLIVSSAIIRDTYQAFDVIRGLNTKFIIMLFRRLTAWSWRREAGVEIKCFLSCTVRVSALEIK